MKILARWNKKELVHIAYIDGARTTCIMNDGTFRNIPHSELKVIDEAFIPPKKLDKKEKLKG